MNTPVQDELDTVFAPVWWMIEFNPTILNFYRWYFEFWEVPRPQIGDV